eukprot:TRINITY_DN18511_c0_g1_i4.p1 TRINITY_DN18511_c0_g1~~TRINITY_DN18511_c0_g1_i4.p1  ORF type:complete len:460 (+),score=74.76 TRINITY_DN18511_c0_g1_i4:62-1381(+)
MFGASSSGFGFGQSSGGFSFGQSSSGSLFGQPQASSSAFGGFGTFGQSSYGSLFGGGFGQSSSTAFGFGQRSGAFGGGGGLFGQSSGAFGGGGLFGQSSSASLFGGQSSFSLFGQSSGFGLSQPGMFGATWGQPQQQQQQQQAQQFQQLQMGQYLPIVPANLEAIKDIEGIKDSLDPQNQAYRFRHLFLNRVDDPNARVKPAGISEQSWSRAMQLAGGKDNPDKLWPVLANGYSDLLGRKKAQEEVIKEDQQKLEELKTQLLSQIKNKLQELTQRLQEAENTHADQSTRMLHIVRMLDVLDSRFAGEVSLNGGYESRQDVHECMQALDDIQIELYPPGGQGMLKQVNQLKVNVQLVKQRELNGGSRQQRSPQLQYSSQNQIKLTESDTKVVEELLLQNNEAIKQLQEVLRKQCRDLQIIELSGGSPGNGMQLEFVSGYR